MMKKILVFIFLFFSFVSYSQQKDKEDEFWINYLIASSITTEKQDGKIYRLENSISGFGIRKLWGVERDSIFLGLGLGLNYSNFISEYYNNNKQYLLKKKYLEVPLLFTAEFSFDSINSAVSYTIGLYASLLLRSSKKTNTESEVVDTFPGANFGLLLEAGYTYKHIKLSMPLKLEFARLYDANKEVKIEPVWGVNILILDLPLMIYNIFL